MKGSARRLLSVRAALLFVVLLPMIGMVVLAVGNVRDADAEVHAADRAQEAADEAVAAAAYVGALADELYWAAADATTVELGVTPDMLRSAFDLDLPGEIERSRRATDAAWAVTAGRPEETPLVGARARLDAGDFDASALAYRQALRVAERDVGRTLLALRQATSGVGDSGELLAAAADLEASVVLRSDMYGMVESLFASRFPTQTASENGTTPAVELVQSQARYESLLADLAEGLDPASPTGEVVSRLWNEPAIAGLLAAVDQEIRSQADGAVRFQDGDTASADFANTLVAVELHNELVDAAEAEVRSAGAEVGARGERTRADVLLGVGFVVVATSVVLLVVGRWLVRSLDGLSGAASAMKGGDLHAAAPVAGPYEVKVAAEALNAASASLRSAEAQVRALADTDDEPSARGRAAGPLGMSLDDAFDRLEVALEEQEVLRQHLVHEASHDALTGLANRAAILDRLAEVVEQAGGSGTGVGVLFVDLDNFKTINDLHGHDTGDDVLRQVAERLRACARGQDTVGRLGGDEFVVVAAGIAGEDDAMALAQRVTEAVAEPLRTAAGTIFPELSVGVATATAAEADAARLLTDADLAVYRAKKAGGESVALCTPTLREESARVLRTEEELRDAVRAGELDLHYQAIVAAVDGSFTGFESLVRWPQADGAVRTPAEFVPVAERSNLVIELDRWVLDRALGQLAAWSTSPETADIGVAVNVSARHACTRGFATEVLRSLEHHRVDPRRLTLELTESAIIANEEQIISELRALRRHGVETALDDFGTGYTSLALLDRLPVDTLKLDETLTRDLRDDRLLAVARLIVATAHVLGMRVTAERVESVEQVRRLRDLGVDRLQGYLFHRPAAAPEAVQAAVRDEVLSTPDPDDESSGDGPRGAQTSRVRSSQPPSSTSTSHQAVNTA